MKKKFKLSSKDFSILINICFQLIVNHSLFRIRNSSFSLSIFAGIHRDENIRCPSIMTPSKIGGILFFILILSSNRVMWHFMGDLPARIIHTTYHLNNFSLPLMKINVSIHEIKIIHSMKSKSSCCIDIEYATTQCENPSPWIRSHTKEKQLSKISTTLIQY